MAGVTILVVNKDHNF